MRPNKDLIIYNSLTSQKEKFNTINKDMVGMYVCGPTVYNTVHLGNCRTFISFSTVTGEFGGKFKDKLTKREFLDYIRT